MVPWKALETATPLRETLWGVHNILVCVAGGFQPLKILEDFRDGKGSILITVPSAARGLDLLDVRHVYNLEPPVDAAEYVHRAGRAARLGGDPTKKVTVTTLADPANGEDVMFESLSNRLGFELISQDEPEISMLGEGENMKDEDKELLAEQFTELLKLQDADKTQMPSEEQLPGKAVEPVYDLLDEDDDELSDGRQEAGGERELVLWERIASSQVVDAPSKANMIYRAKMCNKFIGAGETGSSTDLYRIAAADLANCSEYSSSDAVLLVANGDRSDRVSPVDSDGALQGLYKTQLKLLVEAGATVVTQPRAEREMVYNVGQQELASVLQGPQCSYVEERDEGIWNPFAM